MTAARSGGHRYVGEGERAPVARAPGALALLDPDIQGRITLEHGYGHRFGMRDAELSAHVSGFATRAEILAGSDVVLLPKPQYADVTALGVGTVLWGWPHCVPDPELTPSPSYLWNSAMWENSQALIPFLRPVLEGPPSWDTDETLHRAIEVRDEGVVNPDILAFQGRSAAHPHLVG